MISRKLIQALTQPWLIEPEAAQQWAVIALDLLHGQPVSVTNPVRQGSWTEDQSLPFAKDGVYVLPVNGPIMKYENCGAPGTSNMIASLQEAIANPDISAIVLQIDSPGGSVDGTKAFADAVKTSSKPVVTFVDGMMASAAMWIGSSGTEIIASTNHDIVGSIGTMITWADFSEQFKQKGIKLHEVYATQSTDKNKVFAEASRTGDYSQIKTELLDPINSEFLSAIRTNRAGKIDTAKENVLTGKIYMAKDAIKHGLVDKIGTLDMAIKRAKSLAAAKQKNMSTTNAAFALTLAAAKATSFELVDNIGFGLSEDNLNNIESALSAAAGLQGQIDSLTTQLAAANDSLTKANDQVTQLTENNATLTTKLATMGKKPAATAADPGAAMDDVESGNNKHLTSVDIEKRELEALRAKRK